MKPNLARVAKQKAVGADGLLLRPRPDLRLPAAAYLVFQAGGEIRAGVFQLAGHIPFHGALGDAQQFGDSPGALELLDEISKTDRRMVALDTRQARA